MNLSECINAFPTKHLYKHQFPAMEIDKAKQKEEGCPMDITELRAEIDQIDDELVKLFCARMEVSAKVADYKRERNLPIFVPLLHHF